MCTHSHPHFVVGVALLAKSVGNRIDHVDLEKVRRGRVGIVESLFLDVKSARRVHRRVCHGNFDNPSAALAAQQQSSSSHHLLPSSGAVVVALSVYISIPLTRTRLPDVSIHLPLPDCIMLLCDVQQADCTYGLWVVRTAGIYIHIYTTHKQARGRSQRPGQQQHSAGIDLRSWGGYECETLYSTLYAMRIPPTSER